MKVVKLLEKKEVIRLFGVGLWIAPLINSFLTYLALPASQVGASGLKAYWNILLSGTNVQHVLDLSSLVIGTLFLMGAKSAWKYMLALLGGYMIMQLLNLGQNLRNNPLNGLFFLANVALFLFIADQLAFKQKRPAPQVEAASKSKTNTVRSAESLAVKTESLLPQNANASSPQTQLYAAFSSQQNAQPVSITETKSIVPPATVVSIQQKPKANPAPRQQVVRRSQAKIIVHFHNHGAWAQVIAISSQGIELRSYGKIPLQIAEREVELNLAPDLDLRAKLKSHNGSHYFFEYTNLAPSRIHRLNQWLLAQAS